MTTTHALHQLFATRGYDMPAPPINNQGEGSAPINWALVKYWGKRNPELNLPAVSSLSLAVPLFTRTSLKISREDCFILDDVEILRSRTAHKRIFAYLDFILGPGRPGLSIISYNDVETSTGLASSASGVAALVRALDSLYGWRMESKVLSILARIGSGSACRSIYPGFVIWHKGERADGMDSYASQMSETWPGLRVGLLKISSDPKPVSSTHAMIHSAKTSPLYQKWLAQNSSTMSQMKTSIEHQSMRSLTTLALENALFMHEVIRASEPLENGLELDYFLEKTWQELEKIRSLRRQGKEIGATMDAGPQIKLLFDKNDGDIIRDTFPKARILEPYFGESARVPKRLSKS